MPLSQDEKREKILVKNFSKKSISALEQRG
jgi:hypothetical protein